MSDLAHSWSDLGRMHSTVPTPSPETDAQATEVLGQRLGEWRDFRFIICRKQAEANPQQMLLWSGQKPYLLCGSSVGTGSTSGEQLSPEMNWLTTHSRELEQHAGEWLLIAGAQLIAHGADFSVITAAVRERALRSPFIHYVPRPEEAEFLPI